MLAQLEQQVATDERRLDLAYEVGRWCYRNDEPCPYRTDHDFAEWRRGFNDAAAAQR